jgi:hypothetical protein
MESLDRAVRAQGQKTAFCQKGSAGNGVWRVQLDGKMAMMSQHVSSGLGGKGAIYLLAAHGEQTSSPVKDGDGLCQLGGSS